MVLDLGVRRDLERGLGGPAGAHASRRGIWFDAAPWALVGATVLWLLLLLRHTPCQQHVAGQPVNAFMRLCYSDVPILYQNTAIGTGGLPWRDVNTALAPLTGLFVLLTRAVARVFGARPVAGATAQQVVDGGHAFLLSAALLLFCCFLVLVACQLLMGRDSDPRLATTTARRVRSWDVMMVAVSPLVFTAGLVSWDLFAVALAATALLAWATRRVTLAGILLGLAVSAGFWPVLLLVALGLLCVRAGRGGDWVRLFGYAVASAACVTLVTAVITPRAWAQFFTTWDHRAADLGSIWWLLVQVGVRVPALSVVVLVLVLGWVAWVAQLVRSAPRRPRVGQVAFLLVAGWLLLDKGYSPQQVLWLVPLVALARPKLFDWAAWCVAEVLYWWAVWGHLGGQLATGDGSPDVVYWGAIVLRLLVLAWLVAQVAADVRNPWEDPVRTGLVDDPIGGVLDHAPDGGVPADEPIGRSTRGAVAPHSDDAPAEGWDADGLEGLDARDAADLAPGPGGSHSTRRLPDEPMTRRDGPDAP